MAKRATAGTVIEGKYRLERELGAGGMGAVWLATQLMVDRPVAVKLLHPSFVDSEDIQARFEVEAKAIGRLNHPNVITLYDFGFSDELDAFYTVIEYIDGDSLDKRLNRRMPLPEIVRIIRQIALALDHAHHHKILHRDLKPENVMLAPMTDGSEIVKVLDFGIARIVKGDDAAHDTRITKAGEVFGTPAYMSPEQARSIRELAPSADLYSLGVIFYELVGGTLPFFAESAFDLLMLHVTQPVPPLRRPDVPEELTAIVYRLLEKDPLRRFRSGSDLVKALDALDLEEETPSEEEEFDAAPTRLDPMPSPTIATPPPDSPLASSGPTPVPTASPSPATRHVAPTAVGGLDATATDHALISQTASFPRAEERRGLYVGLAALAVAAFVVLGSLAYAFLHAGDGAETTHAGDESPVVTATKKPTDTPPQPAVVSTTNSGAQPVKQTNNAPTPSTVVGASNERPKPAVPRKRRRRRHRPRRSHNARKHRAATTGSSDALNHRVTLSPGKSAVDHRLHL